MISAVGQGMTSDHHERRIRVLRRPPPYTRSLQAKTLKSLGYRERLPVSISLYWTWLQRSLRIGLSQWLDFRDQWSVNEQERQGFKALSGNIAIQVYCAPRGWKLPAKLREVFGEWDRGGSGNFRGVGRARRLPVVLVTVLLPVGDQRGQPERWRRVWQQRKAALAKRPEDWRRADDRRRGQARRAGRHPVTLSRRVLSDFSGYLSPVKTWHDGRFRGLILRVAAQSCGQRALWPFRAIQGRRLGVDFA